MHIRKRYIVCITLITSIVLYFSLRENFATIINHIVNVKWVYLIAAVGALLLYFAFDAYTLKIIAKQIKYKISLKRSFVIVYLLNFFNNITPFATGGQPAQIYFLNKYKVKTEDSVVISLQNFIVFQIVLVIYGTIVLMFVANEHSLSTLGVGLYAVALGYLVNVFVIVMLLFITFGNSLVLKVSSRIVAILNKLKIVKNPDKVIKQIEDSVQRMYQSSNLLFSNKLLIVRLVLLNVIKITVYYSIPAILAIGMGVNSISVVNMIFGVAFVMMISSFVPIPGASGGLELMFFTYFSIYTKSELLIPVMLLWRLITNYFVLLTGGILFWGISEFDKMNKSKFSAENVVIKNRENISNKIGDIKQRQIALKQTKFIKN